MTSDRQINSLDGTYSGLVVAYFFYGEFDPGSG